MGPGRDLYQTLIAESMQKLYSVSLVPSSDENLELHGDIENRSSIISFFRRPALGPIQFGMLFTGDAYDQACDIQDTIEAVSNFEGTFLPPLFSSWSCKIRLSKTVANACPLIHAFNFPNPWQKAEKIC